VPLERSVTMQNDVALQPGAGNGFGSDLGDGGSIGTGQQVDALDAGVRERTLAVASAADFRGGYSVVAGEAGVLEMSLGGGLRRRRDCECGEMEESDNAELLHAGVAGEAVGDGAVDWAA
jgi:hypothetical protein